MGAANGSSSTEDTDLTREIRPGGGGVSEIVERLPCGRGVSEIVERLPCGRGVSEIVER